MVGELEGCDGLYYVYGTSAGGTTITRWAAADRIDATQAPLRGTIDMSLVRKLDILGMDDSHAAVASKMPNLRILRTRTSKMTEKGYSQLKDMPSLRCCVLGVYDDDFAPNDANFRQICSATWLEYLELTDTTITDDGLAAVHGMTSLWFLEVRSAGITGTGLKCLYGLPKLRVLSLGRPNYWIGSGTEAVIDDDVYETFNSSLVGVERLRELEAIYLYGSALDDRGMLHLAELRGLRSIGVGPSVTETGLRHFLGMREVESVMLDYGTHVSQEVIEELSRAYVRTRFGFAGERL
jgi:hypothetical protein